MKQYKFIQKLLLAVLALGCASCSQDEETQVNQQNLVVLNVADTSQFVIGWDSGSGRG